MSTTRTPERCLLEAMAMLATLALVDFDRDTGRVTAVTR